jgi:alpha-glucoside transport system substrate-binding protein
VLAHLAAPRARRGARPSIRAIGGVVLAAVMAVGCNAPTNEVAKIGGVVRVVGSWSGTEEASFRAMVEPFEQRTGIEVRYGGTRDLNGLLWKGVAQKNLPDVAGLPGPGQMREFAEIGALKDLTGVIDVPQYKAETVPTFVEFGTVDGKLVGVFIKATLKGMVWFNPRAYTQPIPKDWEELIRRGDQAARGDTKLWCVGLESRESSGWPGTDWIEDIVLRQSGPDVYDDWVEGKLPWSAPEIRAAFELYGDVVAPDNVFGGPVGAVGMAFEDAGNPMFEEPPGCIFHHQASFMTEFFRSSGGGREGEYEFFAFPQIDPRYADAVTGAGDLFGMFNDTPQARALMKYLVSAEAQSIWVQRGGALSGNVKVTEYPDPISRRAARVLHEASKFRFDASDMMPEAMNDAFWKAVLEYTRYPARLADILAGLDAVRLEAYAG